MSMYQVEVSILVDCDDPDVAKTAVEEKLADLEYEILCLRHFHASVDNIRGVCNADDFIRGKESL